MHKKNGNILIITSAFLMISIVFFGSIYKILGLNLIEKNRVLNIGALDLDKKRLYVMKTLQKHSNDLNEIELEKMYSYPQKLVDSTLGIENLQLKFKEEEAVISYINIGNKQKDEFIIDYKKENICSCQKEKCEYNKEKIIFIPRRRVKNV